MINLVNLTIRELNSLSSGSAIELSKRNAIKKAITSQTPDLILLQLQKSGDLGKFYGYWQSRSYQDPNEIKNTLQGIDRPVIEVLIDLHILKSINEPTKIIWNNPNVIVKATHIHRQQINRSQPAYFSQAAVARALNVSRNAVNKKREIDEFKSAFNEHGKVNINHLEIQRWAETIGIKNLNIQGPLPKEIVKPTTEPKKKKEHKGGVPIVTAPIESSNTIAGDITFDDIAHMTVREVAEKYGGIAGFKNFVDAQAKMMDWQEKESKFMQRRSQLVSVDYFKTIITLIDLSYRNILESPDRIADQAMAIAKSDKPEARIEFINLIKGTLSQILKSVKAEVLKTLDSEKN